MKLRKSPSGKRRLLLGVTLVEILVVVAVAAILAALLLGVLPAVSKAGQLAKCTSNLRTIHQLVLQHVSDHNGLMPEVIRWHRNSPFEEVLNAEQHFGNARNYDIATHGSFTDCPAAPRAQRVNPGGGNVWYAPPWGGTNWSMFNWDDRTVVPVRMQRIPAHSQKIIFITASKGSDEDPFPGGMLYGPANIMPGAIDARASVRFWHNGRANALFLDGHVEQLEPEFFTTPSTTYQWQRHFTSRDPNTL